MTSNVLKNDLSYWGTKLSGYQLLELPADNQMIEKENHFVRVEFSINDQIRKKLKPLVQQGNTLKNVLLSGISILLNKYTAQQDIVFANLHPDADTGIFHLYINRVLLHQTQHFMDVIRFFNREELQNQRHPVVSITEISEYLNPETHQPVVKFLTVVVKDRTEVFHSVDFTTYDLSLVINETENDLQGVLIYPEGLFKRESILRFLDHYSFLLNSLAEHPFMNHTEISLLNEQEYQNIIVHQNNTRKFFPKQTIHSLIEAQAQKTPDTIAIRFQDQQLTYSELNQKSNQLARHLRNVYKTTQLRDLQPDTLIALYLNRGLETVIGILAVLKSGAAYVPVDVSYPQERIDFILEDTNAPFILSDKNTLEYTTAELPSEKIICIGLSERIYEEVSSTDLLPLADIHHLAYIIYTSGTTGKPKGVMIEHQAFTQFIYNFNDYLSDRIDFASRNVLSLTNYVFDIFGLEYALPLITGGSITLSSVDTVQLEDFSGQQIIQQTPSGLSHIVNNFKEALSTSVCLVGGETLFPSFARQLTQAFRHVFNVYGPSETTVWSTAHEVINPDEPYIGKPLFNEQVYILNTSLQPLPVGIAGELYIGGAGLSRGYLNRSELTRERFIPNPFATSKDRLNGFDKLYKTGDMARWLPDGNIEYLNRNDDQVKIRGYRIELKEIEHALLKTEGIQNACVLVREKNTSSGILKYLVGFYLLNNSYSRLSEKEIRQQLHSALPEYMVPDYFVALEKWPLTANGKLNRKALPEIDFTSTQIYQAPGNKQEQISSDLWKELFHLQQVGITDDFFKLGGNSILAIQVSHRMSKALKCEIKVADIFKYKTISQLILNCSSNLQTIIPVTEARHAGLSFAQERIWFIEQFESGTNAYHIPLIYELQPDTNKEALKYALQKIVNRHEVLRSVIQEKNGVNYQKTLNEPLLIEDILLSDQENYELLIRKEINRSFELDKEFPFWAKFYTIPTNKVNILLPPPSKTLLVINMHHIASDGWSITVFERELAAYYEAYVRNNLSFDLSPLPIQYKDYAVWQRNYLVHELLDKQLSYWTTKLSGFQPLELPLDFERPHQINYDGDTVEFKLNTSLSKKLKQFAQAHGITLHSVLLSSVGILLGKYAGQEDVVIGSLTANRHQHQTEDLIGFFVNTQVNRILLNKDQNFESLVLQVHADQIEAQNYQDLPFEKLVEALNIERDLSRHPVFQVLFGVQRFSTENRNKEQQAFLKQWNTDQLLKTAQFDLSVFIDDEGEELIGKVNYATSLFKKETILKLINHYTFLLNTLLKNVNKPYSRMGLLTKAEQQLILHTWNQTRKPYSTGVTIHELFELQAEKTPLLIASVYENKQFTYQELNERSNQLARYIQQVYNTRTGKTIKGDTLIAICMNRGLETVVGILAILKAGAAYVPMDVNHPQQRIDFILDDTKTELILTRKEEHLALQLPEEKKLNIDFSETFYTTETKINLVTQTSPENLAYVIYTSGTTGKPKGVLIEHDACLNTIFSLFEIYNKNVIQKVTAFTSFTFDVSVSELFAALLQGMELHILSDQVRGDSIALSGYLLKQEIQLVYLPPVLLGQLPVRDYPRLNTIIYAGEPCDKQTAARWSGKVKLFNYYGPTEASIYATGRQILKDEVELIGYPIDNMKAFILDSYLNPVPVGITGELYLGGAGLARGYLGRPDLTTERFIPNPFATEEDKRYGHDRLYKTGDTVRWTDDGNIEYLGRNDDQIKIRGYRVELGEIENALSAIEGIKQSCVLTKERDTSLGRMKYLVGYYILENKQQLFDEATLKENLKKRLPEYMIPNALIGLNDFPMTINGKLNKHALPAAEFKSGTCYVEPTSDTEKTICAILEDVLKIKQVGITDDFFKIGGNSILAMQVSHRINKSLKLNLKVADLFRYPTISKILSNKNAQTTPLYVEGEL